MDTQYKNAAAEHIITHSDLTKTVTNKTKTPTQAPTQTMYNAMLTHLEILSSQISRLKTIRSFSLSIISSLVVNHFLDRIVDLTTTIKEIAVIRTFPQLKTTIAAATT